jgi:hypothetical protein
VADEIAGGNDPARPGDVVLEPNARGHLAVETESGLISCLVHSGWVGCETPLHNWQRREDGSPYHSFRGHGTGSIEWADGQIGDMVRTKLDDRVFHAVGWTIVSVNDGLRFTNDSTGHGFCVTTKAVRGF